MDTQRYAALGLGRILDRVLEDERLSIEDGERLFACPDVHALGALAHHARTRRHGGRTTWVLNRHVNYTNICVNGCLFCAFHRRAGQEGAFELTQAQVLDKLEHGGGAALDEIHIVGGCHPALKLSFFEDLLRAVRARYPRPCIKAFTAVEIAHFARLEGISTHETLSRLKAAGLDMLPGGGAEIFAPRVRQRICPEKIDAEEWLRIAGEAHGLGISSNATMLYGHIESTRDRVEHLDALRRQQDRSGGFLCFIPLPFLTANSQLQLPPERMGAQNGLDILRTMAVSRLLLDNIPHLKAYWVMLTVKLAQAALHFGADDLDGTVVEENIGHMAGAASEQALTSTELEHMIRRCGFEPLRRDGLFRPLRAGEAT